MTPTATRLIQRRLDEAQNRFYRLRLLQHGGTLLAVVGVAWFLLLFRVYRGWLTSPSRYWTIFGVGAFLAGLTALVGLSIIVSRRRSRALLAASVEGARPELRDRLNTLIFLEQPRNARLRRFFAHAIAEQTPPALAAAPATPLYPRTRAWVHFAVGLLCLAGALGFLSRFRPLKNLVAERVSPVLPGIKPPEEAPFELKTKPPSELNKKSWGEVRIVEPGHDQKLTKLDVVPLRIEMAARDPLASPVWATSVNGEPEVVHPLTGATEPRYAAFSELLYLDELKVSDWDLVSYYAKTDTDQGDTYASQIYFVEIRPFRDDLLKQTGGAGSKGYQMLNQLSQLTTEQSRLLRETHRHEQMLYPRPELQTEDRRKLASGEADLALTAAHVYSDIVDKMENSEVGEILSHLDEASRHMTKGSEALRSDVVPEGKAREQQALAELIATRKAIQKALSENPQAFQGEDAEENTPTADEKSRLKALQEVAEFRDQEKAAESSLANLAAEEKKLARIPYRELQKRAKELGDKQAELNKRLDDLNGAHPELLAHAKEALDAAREDMDRAEKELREKDYSADTTLLHASDKLTDLSRSLGEGKAQRDLNNAYALKKELDRSARTFAQLETRPDASDPSQAKALADTTRQAAQMLKDSAGQGFGPELGNALSPEKQAQLGQALDKFAAGKGRARAQAAGEARADLEAVGKAFDSSKPGSVQNMAKNDALGGGGSPGGSGEPGAGGGSAAQVDAVMEKLQSLALQDQNGHQLSPQDRQKERAGLLDELEKLLPQQFAGSDAVSAILLDAKAELTKPGNLPVDGEALKHLREKLETLQAEASEKKGKLDPLNGASVADASRAPLSYRQRTQRYYEKLSELKP